MDMLDALVYLLVLYVGILFPLAGWLWEYVRPWAKTLWRDWREFRAQRRQARKRREVEMDYCRKALAQRTASQLPYIIYK